MDKQIEQLQEQIKQVQDEMESNATKRYSEYVAQANDKIAHYTSIFADYYYNRNILGDPNTKSGKNLTKTLQKNLPLNDVDIAYIFQGVRSKQPKSEEVFKRFKDVITQKVTDEEYAKNQVFKVKSREHLIADSKREHLQFLIDQANKTYDEHTATPAKTYEKKTGTDIRMQKYDDYVKWREMIIKEVDDIRNNYPYIDLTPFGLQSSDNSNWRYCL